MRVAVVGGTGFVGSYIVDALVAAGHAPTLLVREGSEDKVRHAEHCRIVFGDLSSDIAIDNLLHSVDAVIYCVGILKERRSAGITFEALQYQGVVDVAVAAQAHRISRFLLMSANGVREPGTPYQETKVRAERFVEDSVLSATIFRPSVIFGDPRGRMEIATQLHRDMIAPPVPAVAFFKGLDPASGMVRMSPVHVEDVARAFAHALENDGTIGKTYALGGPEVLGWDEMIRRIAAVAGRSKWIMPMPIALMKLAARLFSWLPFFPVTADQLTMLAEGNTADPGELESLLGRSPRPFDKSQLAYLSQ